jgi:GAF domain-containing protein
MNAFGQTIGVINIYRERPFDWTDDDVGAAQILASMGAGYILNANQLKAQHTLSEQLHAAVDSRDLIGQAKGIIMAQANIDGDAAFELLRDRSQAANRKLRDIAQEVVEQQTRTSGRG